MTVKLQNVKDNSKLVKQLKNSGRWASKPLSDIALEQYIYNAQREISTAKQMLKNTKTPNLLYSSCGLATLLHNQLSAEFDWRYGILDSTAYFKNLKQNSLVDRTTIVNYVKSVNKQSLKKAYVLRDEIIRRIPKLVHDLMSNNHQRMLDKINYDRKYYKNSYPKWYRLLFHDRYVRVVNSDIRDVKESFTKRKKRVVHMATNFISTFRIADSDVVDIFEKDQNSDGSFNMDLSPNTIEYYDMHFTIKDGKVYSNSHDSNKLSVVKHPSNFLIMLILEAKMFFLPYLDDTGMISNIHAFKSNLNTRDVFIKNNYFFGNQHFANQVAWYWEDGSWVSADNAQETKKTYISSPDAVTDYMNYIQK